MTIAASFANEIACEALDRPMFMVALQENVWRYEIGFMAGWAGDDQHVTRRKLFQADRKFKAECDRFVWHTAKLHTFYVCSNNF